MGEILHEKIQLYIYKPSINKVMTNSNWPYKNKLPILWRVY